MQSNIFKSRLIKSGLAASVLLLASGASFAQQQVNLTAEPATATLPDGSAVPMWGYRCGAAVTGSTATCGPLNPSVTKSGVWSPGVWSPVVITVPTGQNLQINLTNNLSFPTSSATPPNNIPTSLVIVGQLGGGLGSTATYKSSPTHAVQGVTWPIVGDTTGATFNPPAQGQRVQSFATEVAYGATTPTPLTWTAPRPGTYLIESGTHPSIQGPMGLYGILVVTTAPSGAAPGTAYPGSAAGITPVVPPVTYNADVPLLLSEIDSVQNTAVAKAVTLTGFSETTVWSGLPGGCGNPATANSGNCYPPAVNYTPLYYLFNGVAFNKTAAATANPSLFATSPVTGVAAGTTGTVLVRLVNAGLRMHVPSIVGSQIGAAVAPATV